MSWSLTNAFGPELMTKDGKKSTDEVLASKKLIGIYFSAHWCPPCRGFTPVLAEFYNDLKEVEENSIEIIFVSSDQDEHAFNEYYGEQPWVALPFSNSAAKQELSRVHGVKGIPTLVIIDAATGAVKDTQARSTITSAKGNAKKVLEQWNA